MAPKKKAKRTNTSHGSAPGRKRKKATGSSKKTASKRTASKKTASKKAAARKTASKKPDTKAFKPPERVPHHALELLLDPQNPRLHPSDRGKPQRELIEVLVTKFAVEELARAIVSGGYIDLDPIVAYRAEDGIRVREGNRRLCAVQLLLDPTRAPDARKNEWKALAAELPTDTRSNIKKLSVFLYESADHPELEAYIGFRHVNGTLKWPAEEKARYIADLVERHGWSFKEIANKIGSYAKHVERHYTASRLIAQANDNGARGAEEMSIGIMVRALQTKGIAPFLGVSFTGKPEDNNTPVPEAKLDALRDFVRWTFGTEEAEPVLTDSRNLTRWGMILSSPDGVRYLQGTKRPRFERAWIKSGGDQESLRDALENARDRLEEALPLAERRNADEDTKDAVLWCVTLSLRIAERFPELREKYASLVEAEQ